MPYNQRTHITAKGHQHTARFSEEKAKARHWWQFWKLPVKCSIINYLYILSGLDVFLPPIWRSGRIWHIGCLGGTVEGSETQYNARAQFTVIAVN
jgi:hypothetical protein